jgi:hypothetical protein
MIILNNKFYNKYKIKKNKLKKEKIADYTLEIKYIKCIIKLIKILVTNTMNIQNQIII